MVTRKQERGAARAFGLALVFSVSLVSGKVLAQGATSFKYICANLGGASQWEAVGDRNGHNYQATQSTCRVDGGALDGGVGFGNSIVEFDGATGTVLSGHGVMRKAGALAAYRTTAGNILLTMKDGAVTGWTASGKGVFTLASGGAATFSGKTYSWTQRPSGPGQSTMEWVID